MTRGRFALAVLAASAAPLVAQRLDRETYRDFEIARGRPVGFDSVLKLRGGAAGVLAEDEEEEAGRTDEITFDGFAYYHAEQFTEQNATLDAYVGPDGAIAVAKDAQPGQAGNRLEIGWRYFPFYREGFYQDEDWIPTGRYEGMNYGAYLGFGGSPDESFTIEGGPFYRRHEFDRNETTASDYMIPDNYNAYGIRAYFEHNTLALDREFAEPVSGYLLTVRGEYERNDSDATIGTPLFQSRLASAYWRGLGRLEWYFPQSFGTVELAVEGNWTDDSDRIHNYDTSKPIGHMWADGRLGLRLRFGSIRLTPFAQGQWTKTLDEFGVSSDSEVWFGGGLRTRFDISQNVFVYADYSYLTNPNRVTVTFDEDFWGEHQLFAGVEVRFGGL